MYVLRQGPKIKQPCSFPPLKHQTASTFPSPHLDFTLRLAFLIPPRSSVSNIPLPLHPTPLIHTCADYSICPFLVNAFGIKPEAIIFTFFPQKFNFFSFSDRPFRHTKLNTTAHTSPKCYRNEASERCAGEPPPSPCVVIPLPNFLINGNVERGGQP